MSPTPTILPPAAPEAERYVAEVLFEVWESDGPTSVDDDDQAPPTERAPETMRSHADQ